MKSSEIIRINTPKIPNNWDYEESVKKTKQLFIRWKDITIEIASDIWIAREILSSQGKRIDIQPRAKTPDVKTWSDYCQDISGIKNKENARRAFNRLLNKWYPPKKLKDQDKVILPEGKYNTIIIDPAWPIDKIHRDTIPQGINLDYKKGRMTIDAIKNMIIPAADNCHLFLWTTQKYLPISFEILKEWEFKYIFTMAWHKAGGFQPFNLPQYNCEFAVYGRKGSPRFLETKNFFTCFNGKRREHSRKPVEFYDLIRRVCPEPRINIFTREPIEGFDSFGDEIDKF